MIRHGMAALALLGLLVACGGAGESGSATRAEEPTVDSLAARYVEARGGADRLAGIEPLVMRGRAPRGPGQEALVSREVRPPGRIRTEFSFQGVTSVFACNGTDCWFVDPMAGVFDAEPMPDTEAAWAMEEADVLGAVDWREKGHQIELLGKETLDGRETYEFRVVLASGPSRTAYLDADTYQVVRRVTPRVRGGVSIEVQTDYGDFREVDGLVFPHSIRTGAAGSDEVIEVIVESIEVNAPVDDARFERPE